MNQLREYTSGEIPPFAFCEPVVAGSLAPWCIRPVTDKGLKLGGGVDTQSLCGRVTPRGNGWDLNVRITEEALTSTRPRVCQKCLAEYRRRGYWATLARPPGLLDGVGKKRARPAPPKLDNQSASWPTGRHQRHPYVARSKPATHPALERTVRRETILPRTWRTNLLTKSSCRSSKV